MNCGSFGNDNLEFCEVCGMDERSSVIGGLVDSFLRIGKTQFVEIHKPKTELKINLPIADLRITLEGVTDDTKTTSAGIPSDR